MANLIIIAIIVILVFIDIRYIVKEKRKGRHCMGCPSSGSCCGSCDGSAQNDK